MIQIIWRFQVKPDCESDFVKSNGAKGTWYEFYRRADGYLGTTLLRDEDHEGRYYTIDVWRSRAEHEAFVEAHRDEFEIIDKACDALTLEEFRVGVFETVDS